MGVSAGLVSLEPRALSNANQAGAIFAMFGGIGVVILLSMRLLCRYFNDVQLVLGGISLMIVSCALLVGTPDGQAGFPIFILAVFLIYSTGYPVGHTAVSLRAFPDGRINDLHSSSTS